MKRPESIAAAVFSSDLQSILLIQRRDVPVWVLPGGGIEPNETAEEAIVREVFEETGFKISLKRLVGSYTPINRLARLTYLYEGEILDGHPTTSSETQDVRFFALNNLPNLIPPPYPEWIGQAALPGPTVYQSLSSITYFSLLKYFLFFELEKG